MTSASSTHDRMVTAFFDTRAAADHARADLVSLGIPQSQISIVAGNEQTAISAAAPKGFWASIKDMFAPEEDKNLYAEGLSRGGFLIVAHSHEGQYDLIVDSLDRDGAVNMDTRESEWRSGGWSGQATGAPAPVALSSTAASRPEGSMAAGAFTVGLIGTPAMKEAGTARGTAGSDETILPYEENLRVGKRDVDHGRVRLRSYVVSNAVHESVRLRSENVEVDGHADQGVIAAASGGRRFATGGTTAIVEHMDVIASDGTKVGTVDHLDSGERIKLATTTSPDGQHHFIPLAWVDHVDQHVHLNKIATAVQTGWN